MARLIAAQCPNCGANLRIDPALDVATCQYCQTSSFVRTRTRPVTQEIAQQYPQVIDASTASRATLVLVGMLVLAGAASGVFALVIHGMNRERAAAAAAARAPAPLDLRRDEQRTVARAEPPPEAETPLEPITVAAGSGGGSSKTAAGGVAAKQVSNVRAGAITVSGRLGNPVVQGVVRQNFGRFRFCHEQGLAKTPGLKGRVGVRFVIGRDGSVSNVSNSGSDLSDHGVIRCVLSSFGGLQFPVPEGGIVTVQYPLLFSPG